MYFNLAPLELRRKIAMLGLIFRCMKKQAAPRLCGLFERSLFSHRYNTRLAHRKHDLQIKDLCDGSQSVLLERSLFGLVRYWNSLSEKVVSARTVSSFQRALQDEAKWAITHGATIEEINDLSWIRKVHH